MDNYSKPVREAKKPPLSELENQWLSTQNELLKCLNELTDIKNKQTLDNKEIIKSYFRRLKSTRNVLDGIYVDYSGSLETNGACKEKKDIDDKYEQWKLRIDVEIISLKDHYLKIDTSSRCSLKTSSVKTNSETRKTKIQTKLAIQETKKEALQEISKIDDQLKIIELERLKLINTKAQINAEKKINILKAKAIENEDDNISQHSNLSSAISRDKVQEWLDCARLEVQDEELPSVRPKIMLTRGNTGEKNVSELDPAASSFITKSIVPPSVSRIAPVRTCQKDMSLFEAHVPYFQTRNPYSQTPHISNYQKPIPNFQTDIHNSKTNSRTINPNSETINPNSRTINPNSHTFIPNSQTFIPNSQTFIPNSQTFIPNSQTLIPNSQTNIPNFKTNAPETQASAATLQHEDNSPRNINLTPTTQHHSRRRNYGYDPSTQYLALLDLKKAPPVPFDGNPFTFKSWAMSLENRIDRLDLTSIDKIDILEAHTIGAPRELIQTFRGAYASSPDLAYSVIMNKLVDRFGDDMEIYRDLHNKLVSFPKIKGTENDNTVASSLRRLSDLCRVIDAHMDVVSNLSILNYEPGQDIVREKLPQFLNNKWRDVKGTYIETHHTPPNFRYLCDFLEAKADRLCRDLHPGINVNNNENQGFVGKNMTTFQTGVVKEIDEYKCQLHRSNTHDLTICALFGSLNHKAKLQLVQNYGLCFRCFEAHMVSDCKSTIKCDVCGRDDHITIMHYTKNKNESQRRTYRFRPSRDEHRNELANDECRRDESKQKDSSLCTSVCNQSDGTALSCSKVFLVDINLPGSEVVFRTYAIVDEQSSNTFATSQVFDYLKLNSHKHDYDLSTLTSHRTRVTGRIAKNLIIKGVLQRESYVLPQVYENNFIPDTKHQSATPNVVAKLPTISHLACNFTKFDVNASVTVLIGRDIGPLMHTVPVPDTTPIVHRTPLGWAIVGNVCPQYRIVNKDEDFKNMNTTLEHYKASVVFPTSCVFKEERDDDTLGTSIEDRKFKSIIENNIIINSTGHIEMPLPLKNEEKMMPDNKKAVYHRQASTLQRLKQNPLKLHECLKFMQNTLDCEHVELVPSDQLMGQRGKTWYIPVFPVLHPKKKKVRLVFDSAASYGGVSLNSSLLQGPDQNNNLRGVLLRFREEEVGFVADVASMFHSFYVHEEHRDYMRFFWFLNNDPSNNMAIYRAKVHIFGNTCSPAIATVGLRRAASSILSNEHEKEDVIAEKTLQYIHKNFYVDDGLGCSGTWREAVQILEQARNTLKQFNINLHKIVSNDPRVMNSFPVSDRGEASFIDFDESLVHRTLGVVWDVREDKFVMKVTLPDRPFTKRGILAVINSIYDPIGFASPVILGGRLIMRKILPRKDDTNCELLNYGWDDDLPIEFLPQWNSWRKSISSLPSLEINRCTKPSNFGKIRLRNIHVYCDSSQVAIGHVIYLQTVNELNRIHVAFIYGESKVSPKSATSMPRLELCAAVEAAKSTHSIVGELVNKPDEIFFHTDSKVVLGYVTNEKRRFSQYVSRRVQIILNVSSQDQWKYVSTYKNPADVATRPTTSESLLLGNWFTGPMELWQSYKNDSEDTYEKLSDLPEQTIEPSTCLSTSFGCKNVGFVTVAEKKSSWKLVLNLISSVILMFRKWLLLSKKRVLVEENKIELKYEAQCILIKEIQHDAYLHEIKRIRKGHTIPTNTTLSNLSPFLDEKGILRVGGRLKHADFPTAMKHPIILPRNNHVTGLILSHYHCKTHHQGRRVTLGALREAGFYIEKGNKAIKSFIKNCIICNKLRAKCENQFMSNLPPDRLECTAPFVNTGLDVMGPWTIHDGRPTRRKTGTKKLWAVLFTCLSSRAVHIEPLPSLDTPTFQNALRRFFSLRGHCKVIRSDRGTNFIGATGDIDFMESSRFLTGEGCKWLFNPPHASHFGGVWERKIGQIKRILDSIILRTASRILTRDELHTFLQEAASIVNATPLWEISEDPNDPLPISPAMLLNLREPSIGRDETFTEGDLLEYGKKRWRRVQYLSQNFWMQWKRYYTEYLQKRQKWLIKSSSLNIGDLVLIKEKSVKRNYWPVGRIDKVKPGNDGLVRSVVVKVSKSIGKAVKHYFYERPVCDLVLLIRNNF